MVLLSTFSFMISRFRFQKRYINDLLRMSRMIFKKIKTQFRIIKFNIFPEKSKILKDYQIRNKFMSNK